MSLFISLAWAGSAQASRAHEFSTTFGEHCIAEPCEGAALKTPVTVAVNEASGDLYVLEKGETGGAHGRVARFNSAGVFQSEFNGSGLLEGEGKAAGSGIEPGEIPTGRFEAPNGIAVDNSCALRKLKEPELTLEACQAEDPANGDVYVADAGIEHRVIDRYSSDGEYLGQITNARGTPLQEEGIEGVAVDPQGTVWVYRERPGLVGFAKGLADEFISPEIRPEAFGGFAPAGIAVDSKGNFYGRLLVKAVPRVTKWNHEGESLIQSLDGEGSTAVAVEQISDASLVDSGTSIGVFSPEGTQLERLGEEGGEEHLQAGAGIGVNAASSFLYVADPLAGPVVVFGPAAPSTPKVEGESFARVGDREASIAAEINPRSEVGEAATEYHFQYGRCASPTSCSTSDYEADVPIPDGQIPADFEVHSVGPFQLEGLTSQTTYHFRAIAKNSHGEGEPGEEKTFTTQGEGGELTLPDDRGWELVSPSDKQGAQIEPIAGAVVQAARGAGAITYVANAPTEAQPQGYANLVQVLSRRAGAAWSSRDIAIPHSSVAGSPVGEGPEYKFFDSELEDSAVQPLGRFIPALSEEASEPTAYLHALGDSCGAFCYRPLVTGKAGFANVPPGTVFGEEEQCEQRATTEIAVNCGPRFIGASDDLAHVVVRSPSVALAPGAVPRELFEWTDGTLTPVSVLPGAGGEVSEGRLGLESQAARGAISTDGARVAWEVNENLYERDSVRGESVQLDQAEEGCGSCEGGGGRFQVGSADGSRVLFTDFHPLSEDSGAATGSEGKADLYECKLTIKGGELICELSDLTPANGAKGASVQGGVLGASVDATTVYFVAMSVLNEAANAREEKAEPGRANLYVRRGGAIEFIATLSGEDRTDWSEALLSQPTRVSPNGRFLELMSQVPLTGYDNRDRATGKPTAEVYLYDASTKRLSCASCEPSGERPVGVEYHKLEPGSGGLVGGPRGTWQDAGLVAANVPGWTTIQSTPVESRHQPSYLNDEGRLFFNSAGALAPQDANGTQDVYEYEPPGVGGCSESDSTYSARSGGCVALISSGSSAQESAFMDASESGDDVFFITSAKLSPLDVDKALDIYDAHLCTGAEPCIAFSGPEPPPCSTEASCKASPSPQPRSFGEAASATFEGPGNPTAPRPPKVKTAAEIRAEKLKKAVKACRVKKNKHKRLACERQARKRYGPKGAKKAKAKRKGKKK